MVDIGLVSRNTDLFEVYSLENLGWEFLSIFRFFYEKLKHLREFMRFRV